MESTKRFPKTVLIVLILLIINYADIFCRALTFKKIVGRSCSSSRLHLKKESDKTSDEENAFDMDFSREVEKKLRERFPANAGNDEDNDSKLAKNKKKTSRAAVVDDNNLLKTLSSWEGLNRAVIAGFFVAGIGTGITIDSAINTNPKDLASRDAIDKNAPNPKLCATYGSSAMVLDQRVFVTFNPFNIYVTQADSKPGCVLRPSNVVQLLQKDRKLLTDDDIEGCKNGYNTWAFIGDINAKPQLNCVFQSDDAQNEFLSNPNVGLGEDVYDKQPQYASKKQGVFGTGFGAPDPPAAAPPSSDDSIGTGGTVGK